MASSIHISYIMYIVQLLNLNHFSTVFFFLPARRLRSNNIPFYIIPADETRTAQPDVINEEFIPGSSRFLPSLLDPSQITQLILSTRRPAEIYATYLTKDERHRRTLGWWTMESTPGYLLVYLVIHSYCSLIWSLCSSHCLLGLHASLSSLNYQPRKTWKKRFLLMT